MPTLKHVLTLLLYATAASAIASEVDAASLAAACKEELADDADKPTFCLIFFTGYIDGNDAGAERGLRTAFIQDSRNSETLHGIKDLTGRVSLLRRQAHCLPPQATAKQVAEVFVQFIDAHPDQESEPYQQPLIDAIESYYCDK